MFKNLSDIVVNDSPFNTSYTWSSDDGRKLFKIIDLGGVVSNGSNITSYTNDYLDSELFNTINNKQKAHNEFVELKKSGSSLEILKKSYDKFVNLPGSIATFSQDVYALGLTFLETFLYSKNNISKVNKNDTSELFKYPFNEKNINILIDGAFDMQFVEGVVYKNIKDKNKYNEMNIIIISICKTVLRSMLYPKEERADVYQLLDYLQKEIKNNDMLSHFIKNIYGTCFESY